MKKFFTVTLMLIFLTSLTVVSATDKELNEVETFFKEYSEFESSWQGAKLVKGERVFGLEDKEIGNIYRVYNDKSQQGYVLYVESFGIVEATFKGIDTAKNQKSDVYYILPGRFMSRDDYYKQIDTSHNDDALIIENKFLSSSKSTYYVGIFASGNALTNTISIDDSYNYIINTNHAMNLSSNSVISTTTAGTEAYINNVPDYHNYPYGPVGKGCYPTSAAMLLAYYDNEADNSFVTTDPANIDFPINHSSFKTMVDGLIIDLAELMGNCSDYNTGQNIYTGNNCHSISLGQSMVGLTHYLDNGNHDEYVAIADKFYNNFPQYQQLINLGNPAIIRVNNSPLYGVVPSGDLGHAVLGVGYYATINTDAGVLIHDNWESTNKVIWLNIDAVQWFEFIYEE